MSNAEQRSYCRSWTPTARLCSPLLFIHVLLFFMPSINVLHFGTHHNVHVFIQMCLKSIWLIACVIPAANYTWNRENHIKCQNSYLWNLLKMCVCFLCVCHSSVVVIFCFWIFKSSSHFYHFSKKIFTWKFVFVTFLHCWPGGGEPSLFVSSYFFLHQTMK